MDPTRRWSTAPSLFARAVAGLTALLVALAPVPSRAGAFVPGPSADHAVGNGPRAIATGDLNEDGRPDMIVGNEGGNGVSVLIGQPGGGFAPAVSYATGWTPGEVVIADFDADGHLDFAVGHYDENTIVVMRGDGTGAFTAGITLDGPPHPEGLTAADLNADGMPDLAACGYYGYEDGMASVWLNAGTPGGALAFGDRSDYAVGAWPNSIRAGRCANERNGLVTANYNGGSVTVLDNDGTGHFPMRTDLPVPQHVYMAAVGSLFPSLDRAQIVTANADTSTVTVYYWHPYALTWVRHDYATGDRPTYVAIADADGDGSPDVVTSNYVGGSLSVLSGDQWHATLHPHVDVPTVANPYAVAVADFDLDGKPDLVASDRTGNTVRVTRGSPKQGWGLNDTIPAFDAPNQNGDVAHIRPGSGQWRLIDLCSVWCGPCNEMAKHTQTEYLTWRNHPTVHFDYITMLADGATPGEPSTRKAADNWARKYKITRSVLHSDSLDQGGARAVAFASEMWGTPTLRLVDPNGVIRWLNVGAADETTLTRVIANCAGVPVPPPFLQNSALLTGGTETVSYGAQVASSPTDSTNGYGIFPFQLPEGTFGYDFYSTLSITRNFSTGREYWELNFLRWDGALGDYGTLATEQPWQFTLSNLVLDPTTRTLPPGMTAGVGLMTTYGGTGLPTGIPVSWDGSTLSFGAITPEMVAPFGPFYGFTLGFEMQYAEPLAGVAPEAPPAFAMRAPAPNPAVRTTTLAWTQSRAGEARLDVFDVSGRLVRMLARGVQPAGEHALAWDLADAGGAPVRAGLYFARVSVAGEGTRTTRVTVMR